MVVCGKPALTDEHRDTITNPKVIVEVLSPSTADYGEKFILYRRLDSFEEYLLIAQNQARVEVCTQDSGQSLDHQYLRRARRNSASGVARSVAPYGGDLCGCRVASRR